MRPSWWMPDAWRKALRPTMPWAHYWGLHGEAGDLAHQATGGVELLRVDVGVGAEVVAAGAQRHDDLFEGAVAGALADAVDAALDLARADLDGGEAVGHGHAQVVVTVDGEAHRLAQFGRLLAQVVEQPRKLARRGVADGVRDVDGGRAGVDGRAHEVGEEVAVGARGVHRRELHVVHVGAGAPDRAHRHLHHLFAVLAQLIHQVVVGRRQEEVDAGMRSVLQRLGGAVDGGVAAVRQRRYDGLAYLARDALHRFEVALRADGEARLDDVHPQPLQMLGYLNFLLDGHGRAGRLLAVAERRVEDEHLVVHDGSPFVPSGERRSARA